MENEPVIGQAAADTLTVSDTTANPLLARIKSSFDRLRKSERAVADFVLEQPNDVLSISIAELAYRVGVSQPTVARFVGALGYSGFKEFKLRLAQSLATGVHFVHRDVSPGDSGSEVSRKVFDRTIAALMGARNHLDGASFSRAVEVLANASRLEFYGIGNSGIVALDAQHKFFRFGIPAVACSDPHTQGMAATLLQPGDAVVAVSASGRTADLLRSCELARDAGADVIAITAGGSALSRIAHITLGADLEEDPDVYVAMSSRIVHLTLIDALSVGVALAGGVELVERLERTKRILREKRIRGFGEQEGT